jgi:D-3-phosphoglycerate dehydrogenase
MKIVIAEKISPAAIALFREEARWRLVTPDQIDGDLPAQLANADALIVRSAVKVDAALLKHAQKLRVIGRAGVGVDNVDLAAATKKGIAVMNTPGANAIAVAEHTLGMMLALARHLCPADASTRAGKWEKKAFEGAELCGKTLGIVGLGRIGMEVARRARAFQMEVIAHDPFVSVAIARDAGIKLASLKEVFAAADYLSLHVGLTPQTEGMINAASLRAMKAGVRIVNCARGELVDEAALAAALTSGRVAGAALDVFQAEPPKKSPLLQLPNVICTPHIAGSTREAQEAVGTQIALQVREYLKRGVIQNAVNVPSVSHDEYVSMQPYIVLAERLGSFLAQSGSGGLEEISIRFSGAIAEWRTELMRNAAIQGVLSQVASDKANLVNAATIAAERGIRVHESGKTKAPRGGAGNVISIMLNVGGETRMARGAVLHGESPRLLGIDDIDVEAPLERNLVYIRNRDVPGVIGSIGTVLGKHGINIANFSLGRREHDGRKSAPVEAIAVVQVDERVPEPVLRELRKIPAITAARAISL